MGAFRFRVCLGHALRTVAQRADFRAFGIHNGVVGHGGSAADPFLEGSARGFQSRGAATSWARRMRSVGMHTASISTFAERHSAYHWDAGFNELINLGTMGIETADQVAPLALDWLARNGARDNWFLHVHLWDPHTPYRTPSSYGDPFAHDPTPDWITEEIRAGHWTLPGPHSAQEMLGFKPNEHAFFKGLARQPQQATSMLEFAACSTATTSASGTPTIMLGA